MTTQVTETTTFHMTLPIRVFRSLQLKAVAASKPGKQVTVQEYLRHLAEEDTQTPQPQA